MMQIKRIAIMVAGIFIFLPGIAHARVSNIIVAVDGMACPFCAFGVEKRVRKVNGVATVAVDMKTGSAELAARPGESIHYQDVPEAVKDAGFTAGVMKVTVSGTVETGDDSSLFLRYNGQSFQLEPGDATTAEQLRKHVGSGKTIILQGLLNNTKTEIWSLVPESIAEEVK